jgi:hypothetical protein
MRIERRATALGPFSNPGPSAHRVQLARGIAQEDAQVDELLVRAVRHLDLEVAAHDRDEQGRREAERLAAQQVEGRLGFSGRLELPTGIGTVISS